VVAWWSLCHAPVIALRGALSYISGFFDKKQDKPIPNQTFKGMKQISEAKRQLLLRLADFVSSEDLEEDPDDPDAPRILTTNLFLKAIARFEEHVDSQSNVRERAQTVSKKGPEQRQIIVSQSVDQGVVHACGKSTFFTTVNGGGEDWYQVGIITFVVAEIAIMPLHYLDLLNSYVSKGKISPEAFMLFRCTGQPEMLVEQVRVCDFLNFKRYEDRTRDLMLVRFQGVRMHQDILKFFISETDLKGLPRLQVRLETVDHSPEGIMKLQPRSSFSRGEILSRLEYSNGGADREYKIVQALRYSIPTVSHDCGALAFECSNSALGCKQILGFHVAGTKPNELGFATIVTSEYLHEKLPLLGNFICQSDIGLPSGTECYDAPIKGSFIPVMVVDKPWSCANVSSLRKTPLYNQYGILSKYPAALTPVQYKGETRYPLVEAYKSYQTSVRFIPTANLRAATSVAFRPFKLATTQDPRKIYSFEEAVRCDKYDENFRGIPRGKSPGYPYNVEGYRNKKKFFGYGEEYEFTSPECSALKERVEGIIENAKNGVREWHIYTDFL